MAAILTCILRTRYTASRVTQGEQKTLDHKQFKPTSAIFYQSYYAMGVWEGHNDSSVGRFY